MPLLPPPGAARVLVLSTLVNTVGRGIWLTASVLFLTRSVGLSVSQVGLGLTVTALVSLVVSTPAGYLADRYGPRGIQFTALLACGGLTAALALVGSFRSFLAVSIAIAVAEAAFRGARGAVIAGAVPADQRVRTRAYLRATTNVGISAGAALAGAGIAVDTRTGYLVLIMVDTVSFLIAAAILTRLAPIPPVAAAAHGPRLVALRDRPFLVFTLLDGLMSMHFGLLNIALPLWIAGHTTAPRWLISVLMLVNTAMVVLFQVRAARGTEEVAGAARASRRAGVAIAVACLLFAASGAAATPAAVALLLGRGADARGRGTLAVRRGLGDLVRARAGPRAGAVPGCVRHGDAARRHARPGPGDHPRHRLGRAGLAGARCTLRRPRRADAAGGALGGAQP